MQSQESVKIVDRFFEVLETLIASKQVRGRQAFCDAYNINRRNLYQLDLNRHRNIFQVCWLMYLARDYNVSTEWLLTGKGSMFMK